MTPHQFWFWHVGDVRPDTHSGCKSQFVVELPGHFCHHQFGVVESHHGIPDNDTLIWLPQLPVTLSPALHGVGCFKRLAFPVRFLVLRAGFAGGERGVTALLYRQWAKAFHCDVIHRGGDPAVCRRTSGELVITTSKGGKVTTKTLNNWWNDAKRTAEQKAGAPFGCTFHDIKAKGISDYEGSSRDKQIFSGHKTESQVLIYDRKTKITPTLDLPMMARK